MILLESCFFYLYCFQFAFVRKVQPLTHLYVRYTNIRFLVTPYLEQTYQMNDLLLYKIFAVAFVSSVRLDHRLCSRYSYSGVRAFFQISISETLLAVIYYRNSWPGMTPLCSLEFRNYMCFLSKLILNLRPRDENFMNFL